MLLWKGQKGQGPGGAADRGPWRPQNITFFNASGGRYAGRGPQANGRCDTCRGHPRTHASVPPINRQIPGRDKTHGRFRPARLAGASAALGLGGRPAPNTCRAGSHPHAPENRPWIGDFPVGPSFISGGMGKLSRPPKGWRSRIRGRHPWVRSDRAESRAERTRKTRRFFIAAGRPWPRNWYEKRTPSDMIHRHADLDTHASWRGTWRGCPVSSRRINDRDGRPRVRTSPGQKSCSPITRATGVRADLRASRRIPSAGAIVKKTGWRNLVLFMSPHDYLCTAFERARYGGDGRPRRGRRNGGFGSAPGTPLNTADFSSSLLHGPRPSEGE